MTGPIFVTPREALQTMLDAGATFAVRDRADGLGVSFTYRVADGGDLQHCRRILAAVKAKPAPFFRAFQERVERRVGGPVHVEGALAPSTSLRQGEGSPSPYVAAVQAVKGTVGEVSPSPTASAARGMEGPEGVVATTPTVRQAAPKREGDRA